MSDFDEDKTQLGPRPTVSHEAHGPHDADDHSDMADHVDERWLVSYADMMTLLFGLFVLLYSMANLDKAAAQKVMDSTQEKFGAPVTEATPPTPEQPDLKKLQAQIEKLEEEKQNLESEKQEFLDKIEESSAQIEKVKQEAKLESEKIASDKQTYQRQLEDLQNQLVQSRALKDSSAKSSDLIAKREMQDREQIRKLTDFVAKQKEALAELKEQVSQTQKREVSSIKPEVVEKLREQIVSEKAASQEMKQELSQEIRELKEKLDAANGNSSSQAFIAVFINWSTKDHDIDLVIKDPNNNTFDFKKRKHGSNPGFFALDTRRGPGAELWQADRIIPGKYTATYSFYNQYGNTEPAKVSGTIYSPKGSFEISPVQMDINNKRKYEVSFEVNAKGDVQILNQR